MKRTTLIIAINLAILILMVFVTLAIRIAPIFSWSLIGLLTVAFIFILTEQWTTHDAGEFENRFWTIMAFFLARTCLCSDDSPLKFPKDSPGITWLVCILFTFLAHNYDRYLRRLVLRRIPNIKKIQSSDFAAQHRDNAHTKVVELRKLLAIIDHTWMSSAFLNLFLLPRVLYVERQIIDILSEANADELNLIIANVELGLIFYKVKDHKLVNRYHRTKLLNLLAMDRISELVVSSRALLLDGLQLLKLSAHPLSEAYVKNIILCTKEDDLSELKSMTDAKGDFNSMHKLLFRDMRSASTRNVILQYIAQQAKVQEAHNIMGSRRGRKRGRFAWRKILSDVDDTLSCAGGSWPAGMDTSYPKKAIYPGILSLYRELDLGTTGNDAWDPSRIGNLVFLSARPHVYKDISEKVSYSKFENLQKQRGLYTSPTLLAGSLDTGSKFMVKGDIEALAMKKFENFKEYFAIYPEYKCIFIGDNGQGDLRTAEMILNDKSYKDNMIRVYIHVIQPKHLTYCRNPSSLNSAKVCYFGTYIEAAIDACQHSLLLPLGLRRILTESKEDFLFIKDSEWIKSTKVSQAHPHLSPSRSNISSNISGNSSGTATPRDNFGDSSKGVNSNDTVNESDQEEDNRSSPMLLNSNQIELSKAPDSLINAMTQKRADAIGVSEKLPSGETLISTQKHNSSDSELNIANTSTKSLGGSIAHSLPATPIRGFARKRADSFGRAIEFTSSTAKALLYRRRARAAKIKIPKGASYSSCGGVLLPGTGGVVIGSSATKDQVLGWRKCEMRMRELNNDFMCANKLLLDLYTRNQLDMSAISTDKEPDEADQALRVPVAPLEYPIRFNIGSQVRTLFGIGIITSFRSSDGIYEILVGCLHNLDEPITPTKDNNAETEPKNKRNYRTPAESSSVKAYQDLLSSELKIIDNNLNNTDIENGELMSMRASRASSFSEGKTELRIYMPGSAIFV